MGHMGAYCGAATQHAPQRDGSSTRSCVRSWVSLHTASSNSLINQTNAKPC